VNRLLVIIDWFEFMQIRYGGFKLFHIHGKHQLKKAQSLKTSSDVSGEMLASVSTCIANAKSKLKRHQTT
jgi:hypothetical protein